MGALALDETRSILGPISASLSGGALVVCEVEVIFCTSNSAAFNFLLFFSFFSFAFRFLLRFLARSSSLESDDESLLELELELVSELELELESEESEESEELDERRRFRFFLVFECLLIFLSRFDLTFLLLALLEGCRLFCIFFVSMLFLDEP